MKYQVIQRQRTINGHRGPILEIELFTDEPAARDRAGFLRDSIPEHIVSLRRIGCEALASSRRKNRPRDPTFGAMTGSPFQRFTIQRLKTQKTRLSTTLTSKLVMSGK